jgi:hypothetical protein
MHGGDDNPGAAPLDGREEEGDGHALFSGGTEEELLQLAE